MSPFLPALNPRFREIRAPLLAVFLHVVIKQNYAAIIRPVIDIYAPTILGDGRVADKGVPAEGGERAIVCQIIGIESAAGVFSCVVREGVIVDGGRGTFIGLVVIHGPTITAGFIVIEDVSVKRELTAIVAFIAVERAAIAAGASGLMIEAHYSPAEALVDGPQAITFEELKQVIDTCRSIHQLTMSGRNEN